MLPFDVSTCLILERAEYDLEHCNTQHQLHFTTHSKLQFITTNPRVISEEVTLPIRYTLPPQLPPNKNLPISVVGSEPPSFIGPNQHTTKNVITFQSAVF